MSIWASLPLDTEELWTVDYGPPGSGSEHRSVVIRHGALLDVARSAHYGNSGLRLSVSDSYAETSVVLPRQTVAALHRALGRWLDQTDG